jgi:TRAP-type uncharacterized transport system fused permease subunit
VLAVAVIILCTSIIIGVFSITGPGIKVASVILSRSGCLLWPTPLRTAVACLVFGMEVPTTAVYVICVSVAGPALLQRGLAPCRRISSSSGSPPVCGTVFIAAEMVGGSWLRVALSGGGRSVSGSTSSRSA